jgi:hypothetical protein
MKPMKKFIYISLLLLVFNSIKAQTIKRGSINSIGFTSPNVNFSVGQYMAGNYSSGTNKITVGFQQPVRIMLDTSVTIIGDLNICPGDTTIIKANSSPFYTWFKNDSAIKAKDTTFIKVTQNDTAIYRIAYSDGLGHFDSSRQIIIKKSPYQKPPTPIITRDSAGNLTSNYGSGNQWYKDGVAILGATEVKYKPLANASYTVTTVQNGCASLKGTSYFFLVTDIVNFDDNQFIKVMPNPYVSNLYLNFFLVKYNTLNADIFDFSTGRLIANRKNLYTGSNLDLATLSAGIYLVRVYSTDFKMTYTFKIVKL